jgi:hypothetical protein
MAVLSCSVCISVPGGWDGDDYAGATWLTVVSR